MLPPLSDLQLSLPIKVLLSLFFALLLYIVFPIIINRLSNNKKDWKEILFGKWWPNWAVALLVFSLVFFVLLSFFGASKKASVLSLETPDCSICPSKKTTVVWKRLVDNQSDWDLTEVNRISKGVYCPRIYKNNFNYRSIWLRQQIPTVFPKIQLRFSVKQLENNKETSKALIQFGNVYVKNYSVANFYLPFDKTQGVNFESYDPKTNGLSFQNNAGALPLPIKPESIITMAISTTNVLDNTITYQFHILYIPDGETDSIPKDFQYLVKLPDSSPSQLLMDFGLGVFAGSCLQDVEYSIDD